MPAAGPAAAAAPAAAEAPAEEKPKEKTIFTVKLEKIDATQKAKVIREVKAMMPNMNLVEVSSGLALLVRAGHSGIGGAREGATACGPAAMRWTLCEGERPICVLCRRILPRSGASGSTVPVETLLDGPAV